MLHVELDHILTQEDALTRIREIIDEVEQGNQIYVVTKEGKPAVAIVSVNQLEQGMDTPAVAAQAQAEAPALPEPTPEPQLPDFQPEPAFASAPPILPESPIAPVMPIPTLPTMPAMPELPPEPIAAIPAVPAMPAALPSLPMDGSPMSEELLDVPAQPAFTPFNTSAHGSDLPPLSGTDTLAAPTPQNPAATPPTPPAQGFSVPSLPDMPE